MIDNHHLYVQFQTFETCNAADQCTDSDVLVEEILDFYSGKNCTKNVVELIVKLASDVLGINIYIFENFDGQILRVKSMDGLACRDVFVKFTHNVLHNLGNHYDAVLIKPDFHNLDLLLNVAVSEIIQLASTPAPPPHPSVHVQSMPSICSSATICALATPAICPCSTPAICASATTTTTRRFPTIRFMLA